MNINGRVKKTMIKDKFDDITFPIFVRLYINQAPNPPIPIHSILVATTKDFIFSNKTGSIT